MTNAPITLDTLITILREAAGADESVDFTGDVMDAGFEELGYDSLALLETTARLQQDYGVVLEDDAALAAKTPRELLDLVNAAAAERSRTS